MRRATLCLITLFLLIGWRSATADPLSDALRAMAGEDTSRASSLLSSLGRKGNPNSEQARLLAARTQFLAGNLDRAASAYSKVLKSSKPNSPASLQARFGLAQCLVSQGKYAQAEKLFSEALAVLTSDKFKRGIAQRFIRLGEETLDPPKGQDPSNPGRAEQFFRAALEMKPGPELSEKISLKVGTCLMKQNRHQHAANWYIAFLEDEQNKESKKRMAVTLLAGENLIKVDRRRARKYLRDLLSEHGDRPEAAQAAYLLSRTYGYPRPSSAQDLARGQAVLKRFITKFPKHEKVEAARLELALAPMYLGRQAEAEDSLKVLIEKGGDKDSLGTARYQLGVCLAAQGRHKEAAQAWQAYLNAHPAHKHWSQARQGVEQMDWQQAEVARQDKKWSRAGSLFAAFAERHPAAARAPEALYRSAQTHLKAEKPDAALQVLATLTSKFANHHWGWQGLLLSGQAHQERGDFTKAREAYEKAKKPGSPVIHLAQSELSLMEKPSLLIESPKNFTTKQKPQIKWHTRNIEQVSIRAFRIQAEDFFRDRAALEEVTQVDIALCEPDRTWQVKVDGYRKYARVKQDVPLPFDRPGLYLLNLTAGDLEATTAVLVSDLGVIMKTGANQVFVFTQDLVKIRPRSGVSILISDGEKIIAKGQAGRDGVFRTTLPEEAEPEDLTILVSDGDQLAWTGQSSPSNHLAATRSPRAFLFSDRPVYRPGEQVHLSGIFRDVVAGQYASRAGEHLDLTLLQNGKPLLKRQVKLDEFGVFHTRVQLDKSAREGHYHFQVRLADKASFSGSFQVREFRKLPFELKVELDRPVFFRGEEISGSIVLRTPEGSPAANQQLRYQLLQERKWRTASTNAEGMVPFSFPSLGYEESQGLLIQVQLTRGHQSAEARALLAVAGFHLTMTTPQNALFSGQPFELKLQAKTPDGKGKKTQLTFEALRRAKHGGGEVRVLSKKVNTNDQGEGKLTISLDKPGTHVLRLLGHDRAGQPVIAEHSISLVGKEQPGIWLDLNSETQTLGQPAQVVVHSRVKKALLLLTTETEQVLSHRAIPVSEGANKIKLPITPDLAPNFQLSAALMDEDKLHLASRQVRIDQKLTVKLRTDKLEYGPGEEVTLTALVKDSAGKAMDTRLLVSVIDEALLAAFPESLPDLLGTFHASRSTGGVMTSASNTHRFSQVVGAEVVRAEVDEASSSAAMNALKKKRVVLTEKGIGDFEKLAELKGRSSGVMGLLGTGVGGGGLGARGYGRGAAIRSGKASIRGGLGAAWRHHFEESAIFIHDLRTGPDGVASATFRLPDSITRWRITARGVTQSTHLGEARHEIKASKPFWVRLIMPPTLQRGDRISPLARLYNNTAQDVQATVTLTLNDKPQSAQVKVAARRAGEVNFAPFSVAEKSDELEFKLQAKAGALADGLVHKVPTRPRGVRQESRAEGLLGASAKRTLELPAGLTHAQLKIRASQQVAQFFLGSPLDPLLFGDRPEEALAAIELRKLLGQKADPAVRDLIEQRLQRALAHLMAVQRSDGGWGWSKKSQKSSIEVTATAIRALARAKPLAGQLGWPYPQADVDNGVGWLSGQLTRLAPDDFKLRTEVIWALAHVNSKLIPQVLLHRLHRLRSSLGLGAQALLGLAWHEMGRPEQASEMLSAMGSDLGFGVLPLEHGSWAKRKPVSDLDRIRALRLIALVSPSDKRLAQGKAWLWTRGHLLGWWYPRQATEALATMGTLLKAEVKGARTRVTVLVNGQSAGTMDLGGGEHSATLQVGPELLAQGPNKIELKAQGSPGGMFSAVLSGFRADAPAQDPKATLRIERHIEPVPEMYKGVPIAAGFSVVTPDTKRWVNAIDQIPAHRSVQVSLSIERDFAPALDHCVVEERIPAGFELVQDSVTGNRTHHQRDGQRLAFYLASAGKKMRLSYKLRAVNPGSFQFAPARLRSLAHPGLTHLGPASKFEIKEASASPIKVRPTPQELYQRGMRASEEKDHPEVVKSLEALWEGFTLRSGNINPVLSKLLFASIATGDHPRILKYFELAKEKNPSLVIPFDKIAPVQQAYRQAKAHEGGLHLARGIAEAQFVRQLAAVGKLEAQDEMAEAMDLVRLLIAAYPDNHLTAQATYSFSQVIFGRADRLSEGEELKGFDRPALLDEVAAFMSGFLGRHPQNVQAPVAIFSLASALIELERAGEAIGWCAVGLSQHKESDMAPALAYLKAFAHFSKGEYGPSLDLCKQVEDTAEDEENKEMARYIMAQIHHARGQLKEALAYYRMVRERFRDADESITELEQAWFKIPEVVRAPAGRRPELEVQARNVSQLDIRAYKVDLMKLYLLKGSLSNLADINLAGIKPIFTRTMRLSPKRQAGVFEQNLSLPLPGRGAYLVLARSENQLAHSLALVDSLDLEISELAARGRVRVAVRDARGRSIPAARVQLKGDDNERFTAGNTDLRGIFIGDDLEGPVTVIAMHKGGYGLYRGQQQMEADGGDDEDYDQPPRPMKRRQRIDFDQRLIEGQLNNMPAANENAIDFFNQDVQGMAVEQAK